MKYLIQVTQEKINLGERGNCHTCPVALAFSEVFPNRNIYVGNQSILIDNNLVVPLPETVQRFTLMFDCKMQVEPFEFEIDI